MFLFMTISIYTQEKNIFIPYKQSFWYPKAIKFYVNSIKDLQLSMYICCTFQGGFPPCKIIFY